MLWEQNNIIYWGKKIMSCGNNISFLWEQKDEIWIDTPLHCKSDTKCHVFCKWFLEWSNGMSPRVKTLLHGIESLIRYGVPDFKGKRTNHSTTYYFVPTRKICCYHNSCQFKSRPFGLVWILTRPFTVNQIQIITCSVNITCGNKILYWGNKIIFSLAWP
jgi:hypothetical protein